MKAAVSTASDGFSYEMRNGIAIISINFENEALNTLKLTSLANIQTLLAEITIQPSLKGLIFISTKSDCFIAGADVKMIAKCQTQDEAEQLSVLGQRLFSQIEGLAVPVVAAINGSCLGGGLELALACSARIISDNIKTRLGLPEVKLGLLPGSGGTQRLPALIGLSKALPLMLTGKQLSPKQALALGLVDDLVPESILLASAINLLEKLRQHKPLPRSKSLVDVLLNIAFLKNFWLKQAKKQVLKQTKGLYPAPLEILAVLAYPCGSGAAYKHEASSFAKLAMSAESGALRQLFFSTTGLKKSQDALYPLSVEPISRLLVIGGGLMGSGIAAESVMRADVPVRLKETTEQGILNSKNHLNRLLLTRLKRRQVSPWEYERQLTMLSASINTAGMALTDMAIEAVFEDLKLKQQILQEVETYGSESTLFASNTSSIPISDIASKAKRPANVIGLHYFSPVDKMPLVEVIPHAGTSEFSIKRTLEFARKQGKTPIVVKDRAGFYVNRILAPYIKETLALIKEGLAIEHIDEAMLNFGFPIGPCRLLDQVGIDVAAKISPILTTALGERFAGEPFLDTMLVNGRLGKKSGEGFYIYKQNDENGLVKKLIKLIKAEQEHPVSADIYQLIGVSQTKLMSPTTIVQRCLFPMLNEAARCLDEGIVSSSEDGDIAAVFGIGFPPFLGGPFYYLKQQGIAKIIGQMQILADEFGESYQACAALQKMIASKM